MAIKLNALLNPARLVALFQRGTSLALIGPPGIGKSSVTRQWPEILTRALGLDTPFGFWEQLIPSIDAPDVRGFMVPTKDEKGRAISRYTYPAILPTPEYLAAHPYGILFLDEFNQGDHLTQKGCSPLLLEGMIGDFKLPDTWWVITASNRMSDKSGVVKPLMHNINRQCMIEIEPAIGGDGTNVGWVEWAQENNIHPMGIAFAKAQPGVIFSTEVPSEPRPFCTPRSFASAMTLMQQLAGDSMDLPSDHVTQELVMGDIGEGAAASFFGFIKVADLLPTIDEIIAKPDTVKCPPDDRLDAAFAAQQLLIHHASADNVDSLWTYSERLPKELQVSTAKALLSKQRGALLNSKKLGKWVAENRALIMTTSTD